MTNNSADPMENLPKHWTDTTQPKLLAERWPIIWRWWLACVLDKAHVTHVPAWALAYLVLTPGTMRAALRECRQRLYRISEYHLRVLEEMKALTNCGSDCTDSDCRSMGHCQYNLCRNLILDEQVKLKRYLSK